MSDVAIDGGRRTPAVGPDGIRITLKDRRAMFGGRLQARLGRVEKLRCEEHGQPVLAVVIDTHENGWFDSRWTTCCDTLERAATKILGIRC